MLLGFGVPLPVGRILVHVPVKRGHGGCFGRNVITPIMRRTRRIPRSLPGIIGGRSGAWLRVFHRRLSVPSEIAIALGWWFIILFTVPHAAPAAIIRRFIDAIRGIVVVIIGGRSGAWLRVFRRRLSIPVEIVIALASSVRTPSHMPPQPPSFDVSSGRSGFPTLQPSSAVAAGIPSSRVSSAGMEADSADACSGRLSAHTALQSSSGTPDWSVSSTACDPLRPSSAIRSGMVPPSESTGGVGFWAKGLNGMRLDYAGRISGGKRTIERTDIWDRC